MKGTDTSTYSVFGKAVVKKEYDSLISAGYTIDTQIIGWVKEYPPYNPGGPYPTPPINFCGKDALQSQIAAGDSCVSDGL